MLVAPAEGACENFSIVGTGAEEANAIGPDENEEDPETDTVAEVVTGSFNSNGNCIFGWSSLFTCKT